MSGEKNISNAGAPVKWGGSLLRVGGGGVAMLLVLWLGVGGGGVAMLPVLGGSVVWFITNVGVPVEGGEGVKWGGSVLMVGCVGRAMLLVLFFAVFVESGGVKSMGGSKVGMKPISEALSKPKSLSVTCVMVPVLLSYPTLSTKSSRPLVCDCCVAVALLMVINSSLNAVLFLFISSIVYVLFGMFTYARWNPWSPSWSSCLGKTKQKRNMILCE